MKMILVLYSFFTFSEAPYPERATGSASEIEQPIKKSKNGVYFYKQKKKSKKDNTLQGIEKPSHIGSDGTYYYQTNEKKDQTDYHGVEEPTRVDDEGGYYYSTDKKASKPTVKYGPKPNKVKKDGTYLYNSPPGPTNNTFSLRLGMASAPQISTPNGSSYESVYDSSSSFLIVLDYDWKLSSQLYLKVGSGMTNSQGRGRFITNTRRTPQETYQFYFFPNTLSLSYKFQMSDFQYLVPYVDGGLGYFTFIENRSDGDIFSFDGKTTKFGGAFTATATAGLLVSISRLTGDSQFTSEYGANQAWLDLQFKQILGLDQRKDFTSHMITIGLAMGF